MPVQIICMSHKVSTKKAMLQTRSNMMFFSTQGQVTSEENILIWPEIKIIQDFMAVFNTCKFDEDLIKKEVAILRTTFSPL